MLRGNQQSRDEAETLCSSRKVLIFDEELDDLQRDAECFEAHGFEIHKCMSVEAAMRSIEREEFDFALIDQGYDATQGLRVVRHLARYNLRTPFVMVARCKDMQCYHEALALGAVDYFVKPIPTAEINLIIQHYLGECRRNEVGQRGPAKPKHCGNQVSSESRNDTESQS